MTGSPPADAPGPLGPPAPTRMSLPRRRLLEFLAAILVVHGIAIALRTLMDIDGAPRATQQRFAWAWMGVTVLVMVTGLQRFHRARRAARPGP